MLSLGILPQRSAVPFDESRTPRPVRGGTLPWGKLAKELAAAARVPWPAPTEPLPPASAVRGGTIPWGTSLDDLVAESALASDAAEPEGFDDLTSAIESTVHPKA